MLTQAINWHRIFFINVPIGVATALLALRLLKKDTGRGFGKGADVPGAVQITGSLMLGVYTISRVGRRLRLGRRPHARARDYLACAAGRLRGARGDDAQPAHTA
jgi:hypothetical protein